MNARIRAHLALAYGTAAVCLIATFGTAAFAAEMAQRAAVAAVACPEGVSLEVKPDGTWACMTAPTPSPSSSPSASPSPTVVPTSPSPSPSTSTTSAPPGAFPTATSVGIPPGWVPKVTRGDWPITVPGVYEDIRVNGNIDVRVAGVTLRRVQVVSGVIQNVYAGRCYAFTIEDSSVVQGSTWSNSGTANGAIGVGGYTARRVAIVDRTEGFRVGGRSDAGCGPVLLERVFVRAVPPRPCGDWHGDALQGYDAPALTIRDSTLILAPTSGCGGSSAFFYGSAEQNGNAPIVVRNLLVAGGSPVYRPDTPHDTEGLRVVQGGTPLGTDDRGNFVCLRATRWVNNALVTDLSATTIVRPLNC